MVTDGACITDGLGNYQNGEECTIVANQAMIVNTVAFKTESTYDTITIGDHSYSGGMGPSNVLMSAGDMLMWSSDGSISDIGFTICATTMPPAPPGTSAAGVTVDGDAAKEAN